MLVTLLTALSIITGGHQTAQPAEDDARHEAAWALQANLLNQRDRYRLYETWTRGDELWVYVGSLDQGTECSLGTYWNSVQEEWSSFKYECP